MSRISVTSRTNTAQQNKPVHILPTLPYQRRKECIYKENNQDHSLYTPLPETEERTM